jgi:hypothetical protein
VREAGATQVTQYHLASKVIGRSGKCNLSVEVVEILGHLLNLGVEMLLDLLDEASLGRRDEVDCGTLSTESTRATDSVDVVLLLEGKLIVDDETNLLDVDTTGKEIGSNQDTSRASTELLHDHVTSHLVHLTMHNRDSEVVLLHLVC